MKKLTLLLLMILVVSTVFSQAWNEKHLLSTDAKAKNNFYEIQKDFNEYWSKYDLKSGYYYVDGKKHKAAGWKQFKRWEWYWETRVNKETGEFPEINILKIQKEFLKTKNSKTDESNWQNMGPNSSDGGYAGIGRINCITFHPTDKNTFWVGAPSGGLWKTIDGGTSWEVLTDNLPVIGVSEIVLANDYETSKTIYIATGDRDNGDNYSIGVLKSTDDGANWLTTDLSFGASQGVKITRLLMHPTNSDIMYASVNGRIYKTDDGWTSLSDIVSGSFYDMEFKHNCEDTVLYAARYNYDTGNREIIKTSDAGDTWETTHVFSSVNRVELDVSESDSTIIYALACTSSGGLEGIYKSNNSGLDFTQIYDGTISGNNLLNWHLEVDDPKENGQGWYDLTLSVSPIDPNHLFLGGINTWGSTDGGYNWTVKNHWSSSSYYESQDFPEVHADKHYMEFQDENTFFEANDGGIYKTIDGGKTWDDLTDGLIISQMYKLGVSQTVEGEVITGLQDNGSKLISSDIWEDVKGGDGMECIIDYEDANIQYATYVNGQIDRTTDHWTDWQTVVDISDNIPGGPDGAWVTPYLIDPDDNQTIYVGYEDVWKTTDRGDNWTKISGLSLYNKIRSMAIALSDNNTLYLTDFNSFYKTSNGGANWDDLTSNLPSTSNSITYITIDDNDPLHIWITYGGYDAIKVFESTTGGSSWTDISAGLPEVPTNTIFQNKLSGTQHLYAGTDLGVYFKDGDANWEVFNTNLPSVIVTELEIYYNNSDPANSILFASTYGRGLWKSNLAPFSLSAIQINGITGPFYVSVSNTDDINVTYSINETFTSNTFTAYLSDASGSFTSEIAIGTLESNDAGTINATIPAGTGSGTGYKVRVKSSNPVVESAASNSFEIVLDNEAPTVVISSSESTNTSVSPINVTITFNEDVNEFIETDITVGNGSVTSFTETNSQVYAAEVTPTASGTVTVDVPVGVALDIVGNENTAATQWSIQYTPTGIEKLEEFGLKIYPNPSDGNITIEMNKTYGSVNISIIDLSGKEIYNDKLESSLNNKIDLSYLSKGIYLIKLNIDGNDLTSKLIIE